MKSNIFFILIFIFLSQGAFANGCGPKPTAPTKNCDNLQADYKLDCENTHEMAMAIHRSELSEWNLCAENFDAHFDTSCCWVKQRRQVCALTQVPIYGGNYFTGERRSGTYNPADPGWYCDEVYVEETTSQYYEYPDYDGTTCEAYLGPKIRTEEQNICKIVEIWVWMDYPN